MYTHEPIWKAVRAICSALALLLVALPGCASAPKEELPPLVFPSEPEEPRFYFERTVFGTGSVRSPNRQDRLRAAVTGESRFGGSPFAKPFDIAVHQGRVYVTDTVRRSVTALDFAEGHSFEVGGGGEAGELHKPLGIAVDRNGTLYVCDAQLESILIYDRDGNYQRAIGDQDMFDRPSGIDVDPEGKRLFVVDTGGVDSENHRVIVLDVETGEHLHDIGTRGREQGFFNLPRDVALGPDGLIYVTDGGNFRVQAFTQDGEPVRTWGQPGKYMGQFTRPKGISVDPDGNVYVVDAAFGNFQIFNPMGELLLFIGSRSTIQGPAQYMLPAGIAVDEDGRIYVIDQYFRKIDIYRPASVAESEGYLAGAPLLRATGPAEPESAAQAEPEAKDPAEPESAAQAEPEAKDPAEPES